MKRVLLITNRHLSDSGGRAEKFITRKRLLKDHGWDLVVGHVSTSTMRILPAAIQCAYRALRMDVDVINSVSEPPQLHLIGLVASVLSRRPWLAEFRDPLVTNPDIERGNTSWRIRRAIEWLILHRADHVVWFDGIQLPNDYFEKVYPSVPELRYTKLPFMGFDSEVFAEATTAESSSDFTITYAGSFYDGWIEPYSFLDGLRCYLDKYHTPDQEDVTPGINVQFYGDWRRDYQSYAEKLGIDHVITTNEFVPHEEIVPILKGSDVLLHIGGDRQQNKLNVPTKIWDYIGARRPILGIVNPDFRVANVIRENELGIVVPPNNSEVIAKALNELRTGVASEYSDRSHSNRFRREQCVAELANALSAANS